MNDTIIYQDDAGGTLVVHDGTLYHITSLSNDYKNTATILLIKDEIDAIHAAVFPEQHEAVKASEKIETVEPVRRCNNCRFDCRFNYVHCRRYPEVYRDRSTETNSWWCGEWEAK